VTVEREVLLETEVEEGLWLPKKHHSHGNLPSFLISVVCLTQQLNRGK
jgi:hypothetical protein